jgi:hypothetical protein
MTGRAAKHSSKTNDHYTPSPYVEATRAALGSIDLDPASSVLANETVRASSFFTKDDNGLNKAWGGGVLLNPPGGKLNNASSQKVWLCKLGSEYVLGRVESAVYIGFSLEILQSAQNLPLGLPTPFDFPCCFPSARMEFDTPVDGHLAKGTSPTHANVIIFLPRMNDYIVSVQGFVAAFSSFGRIVFPPSGLTALRVSATAAKVRDAIAARGDGVTMTEDMLVSLLVRGAAR